MGVRLGGEVDVRLCMGQGDGIAVLKGRRKGLDLGFGCGWFVLFTLLLIEREGEIEWMKELDQAMEKGSL